MQVGDAVQVLGTVQDMVQGSTLIVTADGREYWILSQHVTPQSGEAPPPATLTEGAPQVEQPDLESMTKDELVVYASKTYHLKLDVRKPKDELISEIEDARAEAGSQ